MPKRSGATVRTYELRSSKTLPRSSESPVPFTTAAPPDAVSPTPVLAVASRRAAPRRFPVGSGKGVYTVEHAAPCWLRARKRATEGTPKNEFFSKPRPAAARYFCTTSKPSMVAAFFKLLRQMPADLALYLLEYLLVFDVEPYVSKIFRRFGVVNTASAHQYIGTRVMVLSAVNQMATQQLPVYAGRVGVLDYRFAPGPHRPAFGERSTVVVLETPNYKTGALERNAVCLRQVLLLGSDKFKMYCEVSVQAMRESANLANVQDPDFVDGFRRNYGDERLPLAVLASIVATGNPHYVLGRLDAKVVDDHALLEIAVLGLLVCKDRFPDNLLPDRFARDDALLLRVGKVLVGMNAASKESRGLNRRYRDYLFRMAESIDLPVKPCAFRLELADMLVQAEVADDPRIFLFTLLTDRPLLRALKERYAAARDQNLLAMLALQTNSSVSSAACVDVLYAWLSDCRIRLKVENWAHVCRINAFGGLLDRLETEQAPYDVLCRFQALAQPILQQQHFYLNHRLTRIMQEAFEKGGSEQEQEQNPAKKAKTVWFSEI